MKSITILVLVLLVASSYAMEKKALHRKAKASTKGKRAVAELDELIQEGNKQRSSSLHRALNKNRIKTKPGVSRAPRDTSINIYDYLGAPRPDAGILGRVEAFKTAGSECVWKDIDRAAVANVMVERLNNPIGVNQQDSPLCGPACFLFWLIVRHPAKYVSFTVDMCERGTHTIGSYTVKTSDNLRNYGKGESNFKGMPHADWITMSALRETENAVFQVNADSGDFKLGITTAGEMETFFENFFTGSTETESTKAWGEIDAITNTEKAVKAGGSGCLLIDAAMLGGEYRIAFPDHWIGLLGHLSTSDPIVYDAWTWGGVYHVSIDGDHFDDFMWGTIYNTPP